MLWLSRLQTLTYKDLWVRPLASLSGLRIQRCRELWLGCKRGSDPALLWLWRRPVAAAPIRPLAWEPPYAVQP